MKFFDEHEGLYLLFTGILIVLVLLLAATYLFKFQPIYGLFSNAFKVNGTGTQVWNYLAWTFSILTGVISTYLAAIWKYLGSDKRKNILFKRFYKEQTKTLKNKP